MPTPTVFLHFKVLVAPAILPEVMFMQARELFRTATGIDLVLSSAEDLAAPELLDLEIATCKAIDLTEDQTLLFQQRGDGAGGVMGATDLAVYFVRSTIPPVSGCAAHPPATPGCVLAGDAPLFTLAHELGHVLGLKHVADSDRLMTKWGTGNISNLPPDLTNAEIKKMLASPFVVQV